MSRDLIILHLSTCINSDVWRAQILTLW